MGWLKNSDDLVKYFSAQHSQGLLSRKGSVICLLLMSSHFLPLRLQGPPRLGCRERGTKDSCGLVLSNVSFLFSGPEHILGLTLFPVGSSEASLLRPLGQCLPEGQQCPPSLGLTPVVPGSTMALFNCRFTSFNCRFCK